MAISPKNGLLFGGGALAAALAVAYSAGVFSPPKDVPAKVTSLSEAPAGKGGRIAGTDGKTAVDGPKAKDDAGAAKATTSPNPSANAAKAPLVAPSFDVVRVEGNGSLVVAGKAAGSSKVEILTGSHIVGQTDAGPGGDFAVVLDNPLKPGDYQFVLRSTSPDKVVAMSKETAVVSVPDHPDGQVLAMVETPGEPSKLITVPKTAKHGGAPQGAAASTAAGTGGAAAGSTTGKETAGEAGQGKPATASGEAAKAEAPAGAQADAGNGTTAAQASAGAAPAASAENASKEAASGKPAAAAAKETAAAEQAGAAAKSTAGAGGETAAAASPGEAPAAKQQPAAAGPKVAIEAVEIEGNKVFIAGSADANHVVRVYANDVMLGENKASAGGRFLVEVVHELPVGDYIVRADLIGDDGEKVIARAAVPFQREPGESVAAVAPSASGATEKPAAAAGTTAPAQAGGSSTAMSSGEGQKAAGGAAAPSAGQSAGSEKSAGAGKAAASASGAVAEGSASQPQPAASGGPAGKEQAQSGAAQAGKPAEPSAGAAGQEPPTVVSPKLQETAAAVIIRRHDTLWQISRRVYGHGIRYSTIYLANQDQIQDPDRIWPGQVFRVPDKSHEGEKADMSTLGSQATTVPAPAQ